MPWLFDASRPTDPARWRVVTDGVMGGLSTATALLEPWYGETAAVLRGIVRTDNHGGFVQMAFDAEPTPATGAQGVRTTGIALRLWAPDGQPVGIHLRTRDLTAPWESFRAILTGSGSWQSTTLPWAAFAPHRTDQALQPARSTRIGVVMIGMTGPVLVGIGRLGWAEPEEPA
jgi:hypothetical protein